MNNDELRHYGVKGQKWGVRRYQNNDGSLTDAGKKRYGNGGSGDGGSSNGNHKKNNKEPIEQISKGVGMTKKGVDDISNTRYRKKETEGRVNYRDEAKQLTDQELRDAVNRLNMEESYARMMSGRYVDSGRSTADKILSYGGTALAVTNTVLGIALAIKQLKM